MIDHDWLCVCDECLDKDVSYAAKATASRMAQRLGAVAGEAKRLRVAATAETFDDHMRGCDACYGWYEHGDSEDGTPKNGTPGRCPVGNALWPPRLVDDCSRGHDYVSVHQDGTQECTRCGGRA